MKKNIKRKPFMIIGLLFFICVAIAAAGVNITLTISTDPGADSFTSDTAKLGGAFDLSISNTWAGTVTLQRSFDGSNWVDVEEWTSNAERVVDEPSHDVYYRIGMKNGDYTSGTVDMRLFK